MTSARLPPIFEDEDPNEWPGNEWPRFLEILRAFYLSDAEQDRYFPTLEKPHYHCTMTGDGYTLSSYYPPLADTYDLCGAFLTRCEKSQDEMFNRLATLFRESVSIVSERGEPRVFPYAERTNIEGLKKMRPALHCARFALKPSTFLAPRNAHLQ